MKIKLSGNQLRATMINAAIKDERYYLNGVFFDLDNNKLVATNGHHMYISHISCDYENDTKENHTIFIIRRFKVATGVTDATIDYSDDDNNVTVELHYKNGDVTSQMLKPIDAKYPNYQKVIPKNHTQVKESYFNASYLALIEKTYGKNTSVKLTYFGIDEPITVQQSDSDDMLVIMPLRSDKF